MKKRLSQSATCNIMAIISCSMTLLIFLFSILTAKSFGTVTNLNRDQMSLSTNLRNLISVANYQKDMTRSFSQEGNAIFLDMYNTEALQENRLDEILTEMNTLTRDPKGQEQLQGITNMVNALRESEQKILALVQSNRLEEARAMAFGQEYGTSVDGLNQAVNEFEVGMKHGIGMIIDSRSSNIMSLGILIASLAVVLILIQIMNAVIVKKVILKPLLKLKAAMADMCEGQLSGNLNVPVDQTEMGQLAGAMLDMRNRISGYIQEIDFVLHRISQKDLTAQVEKQYVGDFESIHTSLDVIINSLSETFSTMGSSIAQISESAVHVSSAAQVLSQGTVWQTDSVEQLATAMGQVSEQIKSNAASATEANELAVTAGASLQSSNQQMSVMMCAMAEISESSTGISKIIKTIEDIAFQTNILALNAAVEAARAGVAGKGFAVVADEVRNLATKSSEAAKQTNALIENSAQSVERGVKIAEETAHSLSDVVSGSLAMADLITKISSLSEKQFASILQINHSIEKISSVVQSNSASSEQSAAESAELSGQADLMKEMVNAYKVKSGTY